MHYLSIVAVFKEETKYLREWLDYHILVGVDHFYLYLHDKEPEIGKVINILSYYSHKIITPIFWENYTLGNFQILAYKNALNCFDNETKWLAFIDLDEFIFPVVGEAIPEILQDYESDDINGLNVSICTFGNSNRQYSPLLQTKELLYRAELTDSCNYTAKQFFKTEKIKKYTYGGCWDKCVNLDYKLSQNCKEARPLSPLRVNHYPVRSKLDWQQKIRRGWPKGIPLHDLSPADWEHKYRMLNHNKIFDNSMMKFVPQLEKRLLI